MLELLTSAMCLLISFLFFHQSAGMWIKIAPPLAEPTDELSELEEICCQILLLKLEPVNLGQG